MKFAQPISRLIQELGRLPGVGTKTAQRLAFHILSRPKQDATRLADAIVSARTAVTYCSICCNLTDQDPCSICTNARRDRSTICVVEDPRDIIVLEKTREFSGYYHVLHGVLSPMDGIGPEQLRIKQLLARIKDDIEEVIICTNPDVEGEATAMYLAKLISPLGPKVTRLARGLPVGGDLEYADEVTLGKALENRREL